MATAFAVLGYFAAAFGWRFWSASRWRRRRMQP
jgi:hypothetical protein